mgnify:CR=1 FL=1
MDFTLFQRLRILHTRTHPQLAIAATDGACPPGSAASGFDEATGH